VRVYRPALNWDDDMRTHVPSCTVLEAEPQARFSGLLDHHGNRLMVVEERQPAGFVNFAEGKPR
jgi:hypothetical protein